MEWNNTNVTSQQVAENVLKKYVSALSNLDLLKSLLTSSSKFEYFGRVFSGVDEITDFVYKNLLHSTFECSSLTVDSLPFTISCTSLELQDNFACTSEESLGTAILSPPKSSLPSLAFTTPVRANAKRKSGEDNLEVLIRNMKMAKTDNDATECSSINGNQALSHTNDETELPHLSYVKIKGTLVYPRKVMITLVHPKRVKRLKPRDRFCELQICYQLGPGKINTDFKIIGIKYALSSRFPPRNLLQEFTESESWGQDL